MTKYQFLAELEQRLSGLPREDVKERLAFFDEMIDDLKKHDMSVLAQIPLSRRNDRTYMGDLLFAVWNDCQSFIVFQYCFYVVIYC